ncbi:hypothetical protein [Nitrosospira multiformis]|uniref:Homeodomain-like domain-containing protein n=1 Tax=Nitrosospira multiformis TaxID=1231 RepID=A0A1I7IQS2_9PROT|nr:hypothetical protein [Nitrosospira multiformis]SFU75292.1 hypothetical protein SAMN05216417_1242 [Nitrosospira multiformis]
MKPRITDWRTIEAAYRAGSTSLRQMAAKHAISHVAIIKHARRRGWVRDKAFRIGPYNTRQSESRLTVNRAADSSTPGNSHATRPTRRGAPSRKTPELIERILAGIADGKSTRAVCNEVGIGQRTVWDWLAADREFSQQYARAKIFCADCLADEIIEIADDSSQDTYIDSKGQRVINHKAIAQAKLRIDARKWLVAKLAPKKYGKG